MEIVYTETDERGIQYSLIIEPDAVRVRGNALDSGDAVQDRACEDEIIARLTTGDTWAWAQVKVTAEYLGFTGTDCLGGCSYADTESFVKDGDWEDMKKTAHDNLMETIERACLAKLQLSNNQ